MSTGNDKNKAIAFSEDDEETMRRLFSLGASVEGVSRAMGFEVWRVKGWADAEGVTTQRSRLRIDPECPSLGRAGAELLSVALQRQRARHEDSERARRDRGNKQMPKQTAYETSYGVSGGSLADAV